MNKKYLKIVNLSVSENLAKFINKELLPGTKIKKEKFWKGFDKYAHELAFKNKKLIDVREKLQKTIDSWHLDKKGKKLNLKEYKKFLSKINYLIKPGKNFKILTKNVDREISSICGPQLVCPVSNARFLLNAANARWVSLYDSLYGTDIIPETQGAVKGKTYNPIRGKKVIEYARNLLDMYVPLKGESWKDLTKIPEVINDKIDLKLNDYNQFDITKTDSLILFNQKMLYNHSLYRAGGPISAFLLQNHSSNKSLLVLTKSTTYFFSINLLFIEIRSLKSFKCGEVYNPTL